jgi:ribosomal protein L29
MRKEYYPNGNNMRISRMRKAIAQLNAFFKESNDVF